MSFLEELKRRNVIRVAIAYAIAAWFLIQVATTTFPMLMLPEWTITFVAVLLMIGFPVALIFAWAFELTPEGLKKEKDVDRSESITHLTGRRLNFAIIAVLVITVVFFAADKFFWADDQVTESQVDSTIAVLPFVALSSGEDDGYFADGLTEEILNTLTQLPGLRVTARTSSFFFKGQNVPASEIAARLAVAHIVEGSVRRDGERLRITAQLIRATDDTHLWSESYDRTLDDVFAVQEDIAENIADVLDVVLDDNARRLMRSAGIRDVDAFIAYQKGVEAFAMAHGHLFDGSDPLAVANAYFDRALEAAPSLTAAHLMRADRAAHTVHGNGSGHREEEYPGETQEALTALRGEYDLAWRLSPPGNQRDILELEKTLFGEDWSNLHDLIQQALQPGECPQMNWTGDFIAPFGWGEQLAEKLRETLECDPMNVVASYNLPFRLIWAGDPDAALQAVKDAESKGLNHAWLEDGRFWALLAAGRVDDPATRGPKPQGSFIEYDREILWEALAGDPAVARQMAEKYLSRPDVDKWSSLELAAVVGDRERANEIAAQIDTYPGSPGVFSLVIFYCFCGAPFDLEVTPNYRARIEEAGLPWPPPTRIAYPSKTW